MSKANDRQHGGEHYKNGGLEHWDLIELHGIGYLEAAATKYVARHRSKAGRLDLEKALHYVDKLLELVNDAGRLPRGIVPLSQIRRFVRDQDLPAREAGIVQELCRWETSLGLSQARRDIADLMEMEYPQ